MKNYVKSFMAIALFAMAFSLTSCGDDDCYDCVGFDDGMGNSLESLSFCEGDDDGNGGTIDSDAADEAIEIFEALGGTCTKR